MSVRAAGSPGRLGDLDPPRRRWLGVSCERGRRHRTGRGYPEAVAMLVQIGDHLSKQYDVKG